MKVLYTAEATSSGGRENGTAKSSDGNLDVAIGLPKEFGGSGDKTNPEQLFAAGYAACFENAIITVARREKKTVEKSSVTARVGIGPVENRGFGLEVELRVKLQGFSREEAQALTEAAHQVCPYSNATRGNIDVTLTVEEPVPA
jgi:lipoyl-dependent peroxiredoxin